MEKMERRNMRKVTVYLCTGMFQEMEGNELGYYIRRKTALGRRGMGMGGVC